MASASEDVLAQMGLGVTYSSHASHLNLAVVENLQLAWSGCADDDIDGDVAPKRERCE